jgi:hypothetical protein
MEDPDLTSSWVGATTGVAPKAEPTKWCRFARLITAREKLKRALEVDPTLTQAKWHELFSYSNASIGDREIADLAMLGLPKR